MYDFAEELEALNEWKKTHATRDEWLAAARVELARRVFAPHGIAVPDVRVSCGFPGGGSKRSRVGECWKAPKRGASSQIWVSPVVEDAIEVLDILTHELVHAINNASDDAEERATKHGRFFSRIAKKVGLEGRMTATVAGAELRATLEAIADTLGAYPHEKIKLPARGTKGSRLVKAECGDCGYIVRTTRVWLDKLGAPLCPCNGEQMIES